MNELDQESIGFDTAFDIACIIYTALKKTISQSIDEELRKEDTPSLLLDKDLMLKNILSRNIDGLEEEQYLTVGPEGKVYLCGSWLMRTVVSKHGERIPMLDHIRSTLDCTNIIFLPNKTGAQLRKELWFAKNADYSSYDLPRDCRIDPPQDRMPMGRMGPPPGMFGAGGPPPGMQGMPPQRRMRVPTPDMSL